jgi:hypothetical protein
MQSIENYIKNRKSFCRRTTTKGLKNFLEKTAKSYDLLYHFTDFKSLEYIIKGKTWKFKPLDKLNDTMESTKQKGKWANRVSASFSHGDEDNIGMWKMYGKDDKDNVSNASICITLPYLFFSTWIDNINKSKEIQKKIKDFFVPSGDNRNNNATNRKIKASMHDIVYYLGNKGDDKSLLVWENTLKRMNGNRGNLGEIVRGNASDLIGYIKNTAWEYESETRISLVAPKEYELNPDKCDIDNFLVPIDEETYNIMLNNIIICLSPFSKCDEEAFGQEVKDLFARKNIDLFARSNPRCFVSFFKGRIKEKEFIDAPYQKGEKHFPSLTNFDLCNN